MWQSMKSKMCKLLRQWIVTQQSARYTGSWRRCKNTSYYLVSAAAHRYLGVHLGRYGRWPSFNYLGFLVFEHCLEPLSLLSALWLCLDSALTFPWFCLWCLGFPVVPFLCLASELGSAWSTPPWSRSRSEIDAGHWVGVAGCAWWSYTLLRWRRGSI